MAQNAVLDLDNQSGPSVAVAFGGGGARGYAHIHVIEVLDELGIRPVAISGASIGSIMGVGMASGMSGKELRDYALNLAGNRTDVLRRVIQSRSGSLRTLFSSDNSLAQLDAVSILKTFLPQQIKNSFDELLIPTSISTTDYYGAKERVFESGDLFTAMAASASIPFIFQPIKYENRYLVDGGIFNPVPYDHLHDKADIIIGVDIIGTPSGDPTKRPKAVDSAYGTSQLMMQSILSHKLALSPPDIFLRPNVSKYRVQDFFKVKQILADSEGVREELKRALDRAIQKVS